MHCTKQSNSLAIWSWGPLGSGSTRPVCAETYGSIFPCHKVNTVTVIILKPVKYMRWTFYLAGPCNTYLRQATVGTPCQYYCLQYCRISNIASQQYCLKSYLQNYILGLGQNQFTWEKFVNCPKKCQKTVQLIEKSQKDAKIDKFSSKTTPKKALIAKIHILKKKCVRVWKYFTQKN